MEINVKVGMMVEGRRKEEEKIRQRWRGSQALKCENENGGGGLWENGNCSERTNS